MHRDEHFLTHVLDVGLRDAEVAQRSPNEWCLLIEDLSNCGSILTGGRLNSAASPGRLASSIY